VDLVVVLQCVGLAIRGRVCIGRVVDLHVLVNMLVARHPRNGPPAWAAQLEIAKPKGMTRYTYTWLCPVAVRWHRRHDAGALTWRGEVVGHEDGCARGILGQATLN